MPAICGKCKCEYAASTCPRCRAPEEQKSANSDVDFASIASMIADSLADAADSISSAVSDSFDGGGGDFGGGGSSGDW